MAVGEYNVNSGNLALWHFNGDFVDAMGSYNLSATSTVNSVLGKYGSGAADFAGGYLSGGPVPIAATDEFSVGCWFNADTMPTSGNVFGLVSRQDGSDRQYQLNIFNNSGTIQPYWGTSVNANGTITAAAPFIIGTSNWYWIVGTRESAGTGTIRVYVNAVLVGTNTNAGNNGAPTSNTFVGANGNTGTAPFDGRIDEAFIIKRCLKQKDLADYYSWATGKGLGTL